MEKCECGNDGEGLVNDIVVKHRSEGGKDGKFRKCHKYRPKTKPALQCLKLSLKRASMVKKGKAV